MEKSQIKNQVKNESIIDQMQMQNGSSTNHTENGKKESINYMQNETQSNQMEKENKKNTKTEEPRYEFWEHLKFLFYGSLILGGLGFSLFLNILTFNVIFYISLLPLLLFTATLLEFIDRIRFPRKSYDDWIKTETTILIILIFFLILFLIFLFIMKIIQGDSLLFLKSKIVEFFITFKNDDGLNNWILNFLLKNDLDQPIHNFFKQFNPTLLQMIIKNEKLFTHLSNSPDFFTEFLKNDKIYNSQVAQRLILEQNLLKLKTGGGETAKFFYHKFFNSTEIINKFITDINFFKEYFSYPELQEQLLNCRPLLVKIRSDESYLKIIVEQNNKFLEHPLLQHSPSLYQYEYNLKPYFYEGFFKKIISCKNYLVDLGDSLISKLSNLFVDDLEINDKINNQDSQDNTKDK